MINIECYEYFILWRGFRIDNKEDYKYIYIYIYIYINKKMEKNKLNGG